MAFLFLEEVAGFGAVLENIKKCQGSMLKYLTPVRSQYE